MNRKTVTKWDVGKAAGVSHMTVTRVLSGFPYVRDETRRKVQSACKMLNYRPNIIASSLRSKKSQAIGVIVPTFKHAFYNRLLNSVEEECRKSGYHIIILQLRHDETSPKVEWSDIEFLLGRQVDGLLINWELSSENANRLKREQMPVVFIDVPPNGNGFSSVGTAHFKGGKDLTNYLIKAGHRKIAFIGGSPSSPTSSARLAGYKSALSKNRVPIRKEWIVDSNYNTEGGHEAMMHLTSNGRGFTAALCANDYLAIGALSALSYKGIKVPKEVSVVGFTGDDIGAYTIPPLTTMYQPIEEIGRKAVEVLLCTAKGPKKAIKTIVLPGKLLERSSVAPPLGKH